MEKTNNCRLWLEGDYILYKSNKDFKIAEIVKKYKILGLTYFEVYDFTEDKYYEEPLLFMNKYWINLGSNKEMVELLWLQKSKQY